MFNIRFFHRGLTWYLDPWVSPPNTISTMLLIIPIPSTKKLLAFSFDIRLTCLRIYSLSSSQSTGSHGHSYSPGYSLCIYSFSRYIHYYYHQAKLPHSNNSANCFRKAESLFSSSMIFPPILITKSCSFISVLFHSSL